MTCSATSAPGHRSSVPWALRLASFLPVSFVCFSFPLLCMILHFKDAGAAYGLTKSFMGYIALGRDKRVDSLMLIKGALRDTIVLPR